jgi:hypothetical protein
MNADDAAVLRQITQDNLAIRAAFNSIRQVLCAAVLKYGGEAKQIILSAGTINALDMERAAINLRNTPDDGDNVFVTYIELAAPEVKHHSPTISLEDIADQAAQHFNAEKEAEAEQLCSCSHAYRRHIAGGVCKETDCLCCEFAAKVEQPQ